MQRPFDLITFDFDGVLLHNNAIDLLILMCQELGMCWPQGQEEEMRRFILSYDGNGLARSDYETHGEEGRRLAGTRRFLEALKVEGDWEQHLPTLVEQWPGMDVVHFYETGVHKMLEALKEQGYRLAMLTNRDDRILEFGAEWELIEPFELIITTSTTGKWKPEPAGFLHANAYFDVPPSRSLHVGDNPYADVHGAEAAGWSALLVDPDELFTDWDVPSVHSVLEIPEWLGTLNGR